MVLEEEEGEGEAPTAVAPPPRLSARSQDSTSHRRL